MEATWKQISEAFRRKPHPSPATQILSLHIMGKGVTKAVHYKYGDTLNPRRALTCDMDGPRSDQGPIRGHLLWLLSGHDTHSLKAFPSLKGFPDLPLPTVNPTRQKFRHHNIFIK